MSGIQAAQRQLAAKLRERGDIRSDFWCTAVERVPRHLLVPRFYEGENGTFRLIDGSAPEQREEWLRAVYDPRESLVTEYDASSEYPTSSATMPSMVLVLLEALDVYPEHRVLDVGTGSGYSAALLCERVGSENVTSIDLGEEVVALARQRLREVGYAPTLVCGDGFQGYAPNAPYDRVVSMVGVDRVPAAWVEQARPGGLIVATLPEMTVRLQRREDGSAEGRFFRGFAFMWMRGHAPVHEPDEKLLALLHGEGEKQEAPAHLRAMLGGKEIPVFWGLARLLHMPFDIVRTVGSGKTGIVDASDCSWVLIDLDEGTVSQGGPRRLWWAFEELYGWLDRLGRPRRDRFGLTVRSNGSQVVWLDDPDSGRSWELESGPR